MQLEAKASIQIQKPAAEVFEGIVNPNQMTNYFITESSGRMEAGQEVVWKFPEFKERFPVKVSKIEEGRFISFIWDPDTTVAITLEKVNEESTVVQVIEGSKTVSEDNISWALGNTEGWANFLVCLKAWLEYGINLRKGAFDFMIKK